VRIIVTVDAEAKIEPIPNLIDVALGTVDSSMSTRERVLSPGVIEFNLLELYFQVVAVLTALPKLTFMDVVVAGNAAIFLYEIACRDHSWRRVLGAVARLAAIHSGMKATQPVSGLRVQELAGLPNNQG